MVVRKSGSDAPGHDVFSKYQMIKSTRNGSWVTIVLSDNITVKVVQVSLANYTDYTRISKRCKVFILSHITSVFIGE